MINVRILKRDWGDQAKQMTIQQFKQEYQQLSRTGQWAIFAEDTAIPNEYDRVSNIDQIKDGQNIQVIPQLAGG